MEFERVLVTGGAGFIGNRLVRGLAEREVICAALDNRFAKMPLPERTDLVRPYDADIRDRGAIAAIFGEFRPDAVVHLAAIHHIPTCEQNPHLAMDVNVLGTQTLLDACGRHGLRNVLLASSAAVYDWRDSPLIEDETPLKATDVYSTGKLANEYQLSTWAQRTGGKGAIARIFNVIGHDDPNGHLVPDILSQLRIENGRVMSPVVRLGNTATMRDYTHADDTARGLLAMLDHFDGNRPVEAFNISRGEEHSVAELVNIIGRYFGCELEILRDESRVRHVDRLHLLGDQKKVRERLDWRAHIDIESAIGSILSQLLRGR